MPGWDVQRIYSSLVKTFFDNDIVILQWNNTDGDIVECCVTHEQRVLRSVVKETAETLKMKVVQRLIE